MVFNFCIQLGEDQQEITATGVRLTYTVMYM